MNHSDYDHAHGCAYCGAGPDRPSPAPEMTTQTQRLLDRLRQGPASTLELQQEYLIHPARQIWELRHLHGFTIKTHRLPNQVALYELVA